MGNCCEAPGSELRPEAAGGISKPTTPGATSLTLEYFSPGYGRVDPLIQLLTHKKADFRFKPVSQEEWGARKAAGDTGEMGGMPIMTKGGGQGKQQTMALLRSLGAEHGYYDPTNWKECGIIDMLCETYSDVFQAAAVICIFTADDQKPAKMEEFKEGILRKYLTIIEKQLEKNINVGKFVVGTKMSIADFCLACLTFNILKNENGPFQAALAPLLLEFPHYGAYSKRLHSELKEHLDSRPAYPF